MILVDSSVWIDYFSGNSSPETDFLDGVPGVRAIATGDLILTEILQGFRHDKDYKTVKRLQEELMIFERLVTRFH